jgi:hypothetical protein
VAGVGHLVQETGDDHTGRVLGGRAIGRSGDTVCGLHCVRGDEEYEFPNLGIKTGISCLMIWVLKSPRQLLGFGLKIKQSSVYRLRHKTNGVSTTRDLVLRLAEA